MNYKDLNTIIEKNSQKIELESKSYLLAFISPLEKEALIKAIKHAYSMFNLPFSPDLLKSVRAEVGGQQFDLVFVKRGLDATTRLNHFETLKALSPICYHVLKNGLDTTTPAKASIAKSQKIANTHLVDLANGAYPCLNEVLFESYLAKDLGLKDEHFKDPNIVETLKKITDCIRSEHPEIKFVLDPPSKKTSDSKFRLFALCTLSDEETAKLTENLDFTQLKKLKSSVEKKELSYLLPLSHSQAKEKTSM